MDQYSKHIREPVLKAIVKCKRNQSIVAIKQKYSSKSDLVFLL